MTKSSKQSVKWYSVIEPHRRGLYRRAPCSRVHLAYSLRQLRVGISPLVSFPDLLAKAGLAKPLTAFGKTFIRRSGTEAAFKSFDRPPCHASP